MLIFIKKLIDKNLAQPQIFLNGFLSDFPNKAIDDIMVEINGLIKN